MDFYNNPIANLRGPAFLALYACLGILGISFVLLFSWYKDKSKQRRKLSLPQDPDPFEIAYLRGGTNEVIRLATIVLLEQGYIEYTGEQLTKARDRPNLRHLSAIERELFLYYAQSPRKPKDAFSNKTLLVRVQVECDTYEKWALQEALITPASIQMRRKLLATIGKWSMAALAGYKILIALSRGISSYTFLVILAVVFWFIYSLISQTERLTARGEEYLDDLRGAFAQLEGRVTDDDIANDDPLLYLAVGIFGVGVLSSAMYAPYQEMYASAYVGGGGCGAGCGASCSSSGCGGGGGCGGGCGGCGG